jgi:hypothetical protein
VYQLSINKTLCNLFSRLLRTGSCLERDIYQSNQVLTHSPSTLLVIEFRLFYQTSNIEDLKTLRAFRSFDQQYQYQYQYQYQLNLETKQEGSDSGSHESCQTYQFDIFRWFGGYQF